MLHPIKETATGDDQDGNWVGDGVGEREEGYIVYIDGKNVLGFSVGDTEGNGVGNNVGDGVGAGVGDGVGNGVGDGVVAFTGGSCKRGGTPPANTLVPQNIAKYCKIQNNFIDINIQDIIFKSFRT